MATTEIPRAPPASAIEREEELQERLGRARGEGFFEDRDGDGDQFDGDPSPLELATTTTVAAGHAPCSRDREEVEASRAYKRLMLEDTASATSLRMGLSKQSRAAQMRVLETELLRAAAHRDLLRKVALEAEARQCSAEDRAAELEKKSETANKALADIEAWMDRQPLSRTAQPQETQDELAKLANHAQIAGEAVVAQRATAERERYVHLHAKREADRADRALHANAEVRETLREEKLEQEASRALDVTRRTAIEEGIAEKMGKHHTSRAVQREQARVELRVKAKAQLKAAKQARGAATERANLLVRDAAPALEEVIRMREDAHSQRVECVLQLKADTEAAAALIRGKNEKKTGKRIWEEARHEAEKETLATKGLNPYKVFKQRAVDERAAREERRQENKIRRRKEELAERLKNEEALRIKEGEKAQVDKEMEKRFRDELGKHVTDARNRAYLRAKTVDGTDILDPSGRKARVEPSQVTTIKDAAFGLGYHPRKTAAMAAAVVDLVASKPRHAGQGAGEFARLVPRENTTAVGSNTLPGDPGTSEEVGEKGARKRDGAATKINPDATRRGKGGEGGEGTGRSARGEQQQQLLEDLVPPAGRPALPGAGIPFVVTDGIDGAGALGSVDRGGDNGRDGADKVGGGGGRNMSEFERQALQKARARQRERMEEGEPQVAAGRVFKERPSFVAKPDRIVFKDFVVGKVHRKRVVLTNVSLTFNTLKVLEMPDEIDRFFEVTYSKPGRLSAGMTCVVDVAFTPKVDEDIFTGLPIRTQTGPLSIPVECTARRVKPKLSTSLVVFRGTVMGETETARVLVTNEGVIPTTFSVVNETPPNCTKASKPSGLEFTATAAAAERRNTPTPLELQEGEGGAGRPTQVSAGKDDEERRSERGRGGSHSRSSGIMTEEELLEKAFAAGDVGTRYPEGVGALEVAGGGELAGYGSSEIIVTFAPLNVGEFRTVKTVRFEGSEEEIQLVVEASSSPVAVFPAEGCTDLRCCVFGKLYIKKVRICNRGKIAMKAVARVPPSLRGCASFSPDMGFVQPGSFFEFGLRFRPDPECLARCARDGWGVIKGEEHSSDSTRATKDQRPHPTLLLDQQENDAPASTEASAEKFRENSQANESGHGGRAGIKSRENVDVDAKNNLGGEGRTGEQPGERGAGMIAIPMRVDAPGQALPARAVLKARLTCWKVEVSCGGADGGGEGGGGVGGGVVVSFGPCFVGQSVVRRVSLKSTSLLPAKFGFVGSPAEVDVQPADGFGMLLPGEERWVEATFSPLSAVAHNSTMSFRTSLGQTTTVRCRGVGVEPVVTLSHTVLSMAPACGGDVVTASVFASNVSTSEQRLEFLVPEQGKSFLKISPSVAHLFPKEGVRVEISFCPPTAEALNRRQQQLQQQEQGNQQERQEGKYNASPLPRTEDHQNRDDDAGAGGKGKKRNGKDESAVEGRSSGNNKKGSKKPATPSSSSAPKPGKGSGVPATGAAAENEHQKNGQGYEEEQQQQQQKEETSGVLAADENQAGSYPSRRDGDDGQSVPLYAGSLEQGGVGGPAVNGGEGGRATSSEWEGGARSGERRGEREDGQWGGLMGEAGETWSRHGRWRVPCFLKELVRSEGKEVESGEALPPLALEVTTVTVDRVLSVDKASVDFGQRAVGTKAEALVRIRNAGEEDLALEGGGLNSVGPFEVLNAFRPVRARGGSHRCLLRFNPERTGIVSETLVLTSPSVGKSIRVRLRGEGVRPVLTMEPADGRLDMGYVLAGDCVQREFQLRNESVFPMRYVTAPFGPRPPSNINHVETFGLVPSEGGVPPGESVTVTATFNPDYCRIWPFLGAFRVEAGDQPDGGHLLRVRGRCVSRQVYLEAAPPGLNPGDQTRETTEDSLALPATGGVAGVVDGSSVQQQQPPRSMGSKSAVDAPLPIVLRFPRVQDIADNAPENGGGGGGGGVESKASSLPSPSPPASVIRLLVGCLTTNDPKKSSPGSFEVELSAEAKEKGYFKLTPDKGNVAPGATVEISCAFEPPPPPPKVAGPAGSKGFASEVGQWYKTTALVHLRGGYRPPGENEVLAVSVRLEGFVTS